MSEKVTLYDNEFFLVSGDTVVLSCDDKILEQNGLTPAQFPPSQVTPGSREVYRFNATQSGKVRILLEFTPQ
jgi:hypothetical protein